MNSKTTILDAHVHIHDCFELGRFFTRAHANFQAQAATMGAEASFDAVLLLSESRGVNGYEKLRELSERGAPTEGDRWSAIANSEEVSLTLESTTGQRLIVVAGRQIVSAENLEVLALGLDAVMEDGMPIDTVVATVRESDALCVLPWGFGKWTGKRGRIVRDLIGSGLEGNFFIGDNSGRLALWPEPDEFKAANSRGVRILPGSDPLPFRSEISAVGRFGCYLDRGVDHQRPFADIKHALLEEDRATPSYGPRESVLRFVRNQVAMQMRKIGV